MATIIVRTNPDKHYSGYKCSQCGKPYGHDFKKAEACARKDYKRRTGRNPRKRVAA